MPADNDGFFSSLHAPLLLRECSPRHGLCGQQEGPSQGRRQEAQAAGQIGGRWSQRTGSEKERGGVELAGISRQANKPLLHSLAWRCSAETDLVVANCLFLSQRLLGWGQPMGPGGFGEGPAMFKILLRLAGSKFHRRTLILWPGSLPPPPEI